MGFVSMAWKRADGEQVDFAVIPINPFEYILAPTEWIKAENNLGTDILQESFILVQLYIYGVII